MDPDVETRYSLQRCLQIFERLGDDIGAAACRRAMLRVGSGDAANPLARLTSRERQVADLVGRGLTNRQIAAALQIATGTAGRHVSNIMARLEVHSRAQIARLLSGVPD